MDNGHQSPVFRARLRLTLCGALLGFTAIACAQGFNIDHWTEAIELRKDAVIHVEERISVTFTESKHGLLRNIPVSYNTGHGTTRNISLRGLKVLDGNGRSVTFLQGRSGNEIQLRIGDANILLPAGTHKDYVIRYLVTNAVNWFSDKGWVPSAELYWNVTGTDWPVNIRAVDTTITFPKVPGAKKVRIKVFTGPLGARTSQLVDTPSKNKFGTVTKTTVSLGESSAKVSRSVPLPNGEGITIVLNVPVEYVPKKKVVEEPIGNSSDVAGGSTYDSNYYGGYPFFNEDRSPQLTGDGVIAAWMIPLGVLCFMGLAWLGFGRDPKRGVIVVQYDPPDGLSGPQCGVMIDECVDARDYAAGIVSLAVKGHIRIHPYEEGMLFKTRSAKIEIIRSFDQDLGNFESQLLARIAAGGAMVGDVELRANVAPYIYTLRDALYQEMVERSFYPSSPDTIRSLWFAFSLFLTAIGAAAVFTTFPGTFGMLLFAVPMAAVIGYFISRGMPSRTKKGQETLDKVIGFREFMTRARSQELEWMTQQHPDQALFEKYLPHAIAFDLTKEWADAFQGIMSAPPTWYMAGTSDGFDPVWFASDLLQVSNSVSTYMTTPPRPTSNNDSGNFWSGGGMSSGFSGFSSGSSGGGGGGYSGGGGGGGGGGSW